MQTGTVIAIIIVVLILLAIWWFMTRAGRARAARRYEEDRTAGHGSAVNMSGANAAQRGAPDGRTDPIVTESVGAAGSSGAAGSASASAPSPSAGTSGAAHASRAAGSTEPAGSSGAANAGSAAGSSEPAGKSRATVAGGAAVVAGAAAAAAAASASSSASAASRRDEHGHPSAAASPGRGGSDAPGRGTGDQAASGTAAGSATSAGGSHERPRFDPSIDGHPVPGASATGQHAKAGRSADQHALPSARPALEGDYTVSSGDKLVDVREMIKILNLRDSEAQRLQIDGGQFDALRRGERGGLDDAALDAVDARLRRMIR